MIRCTCGAELFSIESICSACLPPKPPRAIYVEDLRIKLANREEEILYWKEATEIANNENIELRAERDRLKAENDLFYAFCNAAWSVGGLDVDWIRLAFINPLRVYKARKALGDVS